MKTEQSTCRLKWLDVLKGIGIVLVVVGHIYKNQRVFDWFYSFHMPLFFLAAGWMYKQKPILVDLKRRFQTIVVPYFAFGILILGYWQLVERRFRDSDLSFLSALLGLLSGQYDYLDFNVHLWFLPCFFVTVVFYNSLVSISGKRLARLVSILMSVVYVIIPIPGLPWGIDRIFRYIGFYAIGHVLADKGVDKKIAVQSSISRVITGIVLIAINFGLSYMGLYTGIMWFVTALIGVAGVFVFSVLIHENKMLQYFGQISLVILCVHGSVYRILIKLISILLNLSTDAVRSSFVITMIIVALTLMVCAIIYETSVRIVPWAVGKKKS